MGDASGEGCLVCAHPVGVGGFVTPGVAYVDPQALTNSSGRKGALVGQVQGSESGGRTCCVILGKSRPCGTPCKVGIIIHPCLTGYALLIALCFEILGWKGTAGCQGQSFERDPFSLSLLLL